MLVIVFLLKRRCIDFFVAARRTIIVALTSVVAVLAVIGIIIIWKKMRSKDDLIDGK